MLSRNPAEQRRRVVGAVVRAATMLLALSLVVYGLAPMAALQAHAEEGDSGTTAPKIEDVGIFAYQSSSCLGYATNPDLQSSSITAKGATLQFDSIVYWSDWSESRNSSYVSWSTSDPSVATINASGVLTPVTDGSVQVKATVDGAYTPDGNPLTATCWVEIAGQTDARYVTAVRIADQDGVEIGSAAYEIVEDLSTAMRTFYANVDVYDPATGQTQTYSTKNGLLSAQTDDIGDLHWYAGDATLASVDETTGMYRSLQYATTTLFVYSAAGFGGSQVTASAVVVTSNPEGGAVEDSYYPQETFTIKAYYELYPPETDADDDPNYVINKTYTVADIEAFGTFTQTYTALSDTSYYTMTGRGVALSTLLADAGVNLDGVKTFEFGTADRLDRPVSKSFVFDVDRYYYPNIDVGSYAEAVQVFPMIAIESNQIMNASTDPNYDMSEATRFRLLFGATPSRGTSQYQIKWINTLYVILEGGPSVEPDDPSPGTGNGGTENGGAENGDDDDDVGQGSGGGSSAGEGSGSGTSGDGSGSGAGSGVYGGVSGSGEGDATEGESGGADGSGQSGQGTAGGEEGDGSGGSFSVYQVMNRNDSDTERTIEHDNPWRQAVLPLGVAALVFGGAESALWFRRQTRDVMLA